MDFISRCRFCIIFFIGQYKDIFYTHTTTVKIQSHLMTPFSKVETRHVPNRKLCKISVCTSFSSKSFSEMCCRCTSYCRIHTKIVTISLNSCLVKQRWSYVSAFWVSFYLINTKMKNACNDLKNVPSKMRYINDCESYTIKLIIVYRAFC